MVMPKLLFLLLTQFRNQSEISSAANSPTFFALPILQSANPFATVALKLLNVTELATGLYEIEGYDYYTTSKVKKRMREIIYNGKFLDLKNGIR